MTARWNQFGIVGRVSKEDVQAMADRIELIREIVGSLEDVGEALRRSLVSLGQQRAKLAGSNELFAEDMVEWLDVLIADQTFVASDLRSDLEVLAGGHCPRAYAFHRRGKTNVEETV